MYIYTSINVELYKYGIPVLKYIYFAKHLLVRKISSKLTKPASNLCCVITSKYFLC